MQRRALALALVLACAAAIAARATPLVATPVCGEAPGVKGKPSYIGPDSRKPIRVASVNVLHDLTEAGDATLDARQQLTVDALAAAKVDVVGMQEVTDSADHGKVYEELAIGLAKATGWTWGWCFFRAFPHVPGEPETRDGGGGPLSDLAAAQANANDGRWYEGGAVLSRFHIVRGDAHRLPGEDTGPLTSECVSALPDPTCALEVLFEARAAVWARIFTPTGLVDVTTAHTSGTEAQHADLIDWLATVSAEVKEQVLVCDCNAVESSPAYAAVKDAGWVDTYRALHKDSGYTASQDITAKKATVDERIDYVWLKTGGLYSIRSASRILTKPVKGLWPSDHYGVMVELARPGQ